MCQIESYVLLRLFYEYEDVLDRPCHGRLEVLRGEFHDHECIPFETLGLKLTQNLNHDEKLFVLA